MFLQRLKDIQINPPRSANQWIIILGTSAGVVIAMKVVSYVWHAYTDDHKANMANFLSQMRPLYNSLTGKRKEQFFSSLQSVESGNPELAKEGKFSLLEIGVGTGANFQFYPRNVKLYLSDPNPHVEKYLEQSLQEAGITTGLEKVFTVAAGEESCGKLGLPEGSIDVVVATLVMCCVNDIPRFLEEIHRVLRPGGRFYFWEHVIDPKWSLTWILQRLSANLSFMFKEMPFSERYAAASKANFSYVESAYPPGDIDPNSLARAREESGVQQVLLNVFPGSKEGDMGLAVDPARVSEFRESIEKTIETAHSLGCQRIHVMAGLSLPNIEHQLQLETYQTNLSWACKRLKSEEMNAVIEPINLESVPGYFLHDYETALSVLQNVGASNLKILCDFFHLQKIRGNITKYLQENISIIGHFQVSQVPWRDEPDTEGEIQYSYIFKLLNELLKQQRRGTDVYVGCEYKPRGNTFEGLVWREKLLS
ncbi:unnamed protein product [Cyprideis torosa]|uniref:Uncharacterized protein n=1 Tax=Cyprideis torosa TaxID=163714 RepID=A0A7R8ZM18_9CRUS|nr:unnamed protein product [Cyprideis torosa]CAG0894546.1 unnamed protein product [Cyprideis torosa]